MKRDFHYIDEPRLAFTDGLERTMRTAIASYLAWEEGIVLRMLPHWVSEVGEPVLVYNRCGRLIGLGPHVPLGTFQPVYLRVLDFDD